MSQNKPSGSPGRSPKKRKGPENSQVERDRKPLQKIQEDPSVTIRKHFGRLILGVSVLAGGYMAKEKFFPSETFPHDSAVPVSVPQVVHPPQKNLPSPTKAEQVESVSSLKFSTEGKEGEALLSNLPSFAIERDVAYPKPEGLDIPERNYTEFSNKFGSFVAKEVKVFAEEYEKNPQNMKMLLAAFVEKIEVHLKKDPALKVYLDKNASNPGDSQLKSLIHSLNLFRKLLGRSGKFLGLFPASTFDGSLQGSYRFMFYETGKTDMVAVSDHHSKAPTNFPIVHMGKPIFTTEKPHAYDTEMAFQDPHTLSLLYYDERNRGVAERDKNRLGKDFKKFADPSISVGLLSQQLEDDTFRHEGVHAFLSKRYPDVAGTTKVQMEQYLVPGTFEVNGMQMNTMPGYLSVHMQELCGVGIQLAASETKIPLSLGNFLATPQFPEGYKAVDWYLPQLVLAIAHDSPKKQAVLADIHAGKPVNSKFIIELVDDPAFTVEHSKKLGAVLYKLGTTLMKNAAEGKYQKAPAIPLMRK